MSRRRIVDTQRAPEPATSCPSCGASISWATKADLRPIVHNLFRCPPGRHPRTYELRCRDCRRLLIVYEAKGGLAVVGGDQRALLREISDRDRELTAAAVMKRGGERER